MPRTRAFDRFRGDEEGFGLILVIGFGVVLTAVIVVATAFATRAIRSGQTHVVFGQSVDAAEAGIDQTLARVQKDRSYTTGSVAQPASFDGVSGWSSPTAERDWARSTLNSMAAAGTLQTLAQGQFAVVRPAWTNTVYSMGWAPSFAKATRARLLKSEYLLSTYHPADAILANGDIDCCSSYNVANAPGVTAPLSIHTNGSLLGSVPTLPKKNDGSPAVITASASGTCSSPCTASAQNETVPTIDPEQVYAASVPTYGSGWYDLCPDGKAHHPNTTTFVPCSNATTYPSTAGWTSSFSKGVQTWRNGGATPPGVYYAYKANVDVVNDITQSVTIISEATANNACPRTDGDITVKQANWVNGVGNAPYIQGLVAVAGGNFIQTTQGTIKSGAILAQGGVTQHTSASDYIQGVVIAQDNCGEQNSLQGSVLYYDGGDDLPIAPLVRTSLELELN